MDISLRNMPMHFLHSTYSVVYLCSIYRSAVFTHHTVPSVCVILQYNNNAVLADNR